MPNSSLSVRLMAARQRQSGVALIIALIMLSVILVVTGVLLRSAKQQEQQGTGNTASARAQFAAELGLRDAVQRLTAATPNIKPSTATTSWVYTPDPATTSSATGDYAYSYTIRYKTIAGALAYTERGQPVFVIQSEGQSGRARRRAEIAVIDMYNPAPFGFGLVGCEGVWLDANTRTRSLHSALQTYPGSPSKTDPFSNRGSIVALSQVSPLSGKKQVGTVTVGSSSWIRGRIYSEGSMQLSGVTVDGLVATRDVLTVNGTTSINGAVYAGSVLGTAKFIGSKNFSFDKTSTMWDTGEECDGMGLVTSTGGMISQRITAAKGTNNNNESNVNSFIKGSTPTLSEKGTNSKPITINLGCTGTPCADKTYYVNSATIDTNVIINVTGNVNLVIDSAGLSMAGSGNPSNTKLNIAAGASLRIYTNGPVKLDAVDFNYADAGARPTSLIIYSSSSNPASPGSVPDKTKANVQVNAPNTPVRALVYAPYSNIWVKTKNDIYGALRGRWILMDSNTIYTYDLAAATIDATPQGYRIAYWAEQPYDTYGN